MNKKSIVLTKLTVVFVCLCEMPVHGQTSITNAVGNLMKLVEVRSDVSNELVQISQDVTRTADIRFCALSAFQNFDRSGTNSYVQIESFLGNWSATNTPMVITAEDINLMSNVLVFATSAQTQLVSYVANTNLPVEIRTVVQEFLQSLNSVNQP